MRLKRLEEADIKGKKVLLRLDLDSPIQNGSVLDTINIDLSIPTLRYVLDRTSKLVICSHIGVGQRSFNALQSLEPIGSVLADILGKDIIFVDDYLHEPVEQILNQMDSNQIILLENLRFHQGEKDNNFEFASTLARGMDFYVNDAFSMLSSKVASVGAITKCFSSNHVLAGLSVSREIDAFEKMMVSQSPFTVVLGGSNISTKTGAILSLLNRCNNLILGGSIAHTFMRYKNIPVGMSKVDEERLKLVELIFKNAEARRVNIHLPVDHIGARSLQNPSSSVVLDDATIGEGFYGMDIGPKTIKKYSDIIENSRGVFFSGSMGVHEQESFSSGSVAIARSIANSAATSYVTGRSVLSLLNKEDLLGKIDHVLLGDKTFFDLVEGKVLPGIAPLLK